MKRFLQTPAVQWSLVGALFFGVAFGTIHYNRSQCVPHPPFVQIGKGIASTVALDREGNPWIWLGAGQCWAPFD